MEKSQRTGLLIMVISAFTLVFFFWSIMRRSYMAVALPVLSALAVVTGLAFWIGWTLFAGEDEEDEDTEEASGRGAGS